MSANTELRGPVAVVTLNNPPVNGLSMASRQAFSAGITKAMGDAAVKAIVITGAGRAFSGGADIKEFGKPEAIASPNLLDLIAQVEACTKPVVAAVHGICMGGGLELALGAHYRVVAQGAHLALPEVKLGLIPGAGGTQRLPRVLGVEAALKMIVGGEPVKGEVLASMPGQMLIDKLVKAESHEDLLAQACRYAQDVAATHSGGKALPKVRDKAAALPAGQIDAAAYIAKARQATVAAARGFTAPAACVDAVAASVNLAFDAGMLREREIFMALLASSESRAMRHAFFAERAASKIADVPEDTPQRPVKTVGVLGAGTMGGGIAMNFLNAGIPVTLVEMKQEALDRGLATIRRNYEVQVNKGKLASDKFQARMALIKPTLKLEDLGSADLIIEAVFEEMGVKLAVFKQLDAVAKPGAILATNTSTLDVNRIAQATSRPQDVVGLHFFSPANVMRLLEVVRGEKTAKDVMATVMATSRGIKKTAVVAGVCDGFIGNRMIEQYSRQAGFLLDEGCTPAQVDRAAEAFGFAMGPFRMGDLAGNDIGWAIRKRRYIEKPQVRYSQSADRLCEMGWYGQKTGAGWYDYAPGQREPVESPVVLSMLDAHRKRIGIKPRAISDEEIVQRLVYALVNEGAHILEDKMAARASDIDLVYLTGYGFPGTRGGPMHYADTVGLPKVVEAMKRFAANPHDDARFWQPAPLLARLAAEGKRFT